VPRSRGSSASHVRCQRRRPGYVRPGDGVGSRAGGAGTGGERHCRAARQAELSRRGRSATLWVGERGERQARGGSSVRQLLLALGEVAGFDGGDRHPSTGEPVSKALHGGVTLQAGAYRVLVCASRVISGACCSATICTAVSALRAAVNAPSASSRRATASGDAQCPAVRANRLITWSRVEVALSSVGLAGVAVVTTPQSAAAFQLIPAAWIREAVAARLPGRFRWGRGRTAAGPGRGPVGNRRLGRCRADPGCSARPASRAATRAACSQHWGRRVAAEPGPQPGRPGGRRLNPVGHLRPVGLVACSNVLASNLVPKRPSQVRNRLGYASREKSA